MEYVYNYHKVRNHLRLGNELIEAIPTNANSGEVVVLRRVWLGGLLSLYLRDSA